MRRLLITVIVLGVVAAGCRGVEQEPSLAEAASPQELLAMLRDASIDTERVGEEDVRGEQTVRYRLTVNCEQAEIGCSSTTAPASIWVDGDGLVCRIELEDLGNPGTVEFFDFGVEIDIEPPHADQVVADFSQGAAPCSEGEATPIREVKARETLRRHGFSVIVDRSGYCIEGVAAVLENAPEDFDEQGSVSCFLHDMPTPSAPATVVRRGVDGADAELRLANLECAIFTDSPTGEEKIDKLEAAFGELQRVIRP